MRNEIALFLKTQLPAHFQEQNPRFIRLLELYFEWLYRKEGMSQDELRDFRDNVASWMSRSIDKFIELGGAARYVDGVEGAAEAVEAEVADFRAPGAFIDRLHDQMILDREFDAFVTSDGDFFEDKDELLVDAPYLWEPALQNWADKFNHTLAADVNKLDSHDDISLMRVLKHLYAAKGTKKCVELFFRIYFDEDVEVYYPKFDICAIDDNFLLDDVKVLRDDNIYQEYSYVIYVDRDPSEYKKAFDDVYLKNLHPSGFKVALIQKS